MDFGVVLVTFNRIEKLKLALKSYDNQTYKPKYIIVVNNNSSDGTTDFLDLWKQEEKNYKKYVIHLEKNLGGSGGFYEGLKKSIDLNAEWIFLADDDAYPKENALENAKYFLNKYRDEKISAICGRVIAGGKTDYTHRRNIIEKKKKIKQIKSTEDDYKKEKFEINAFTYVGTIINKEFLQKTPLTKKDYFIYYDDTEHSYRLSKLGKIYCVPKIEIIHDIPIILTQGIVNWKLYYSIRNQLDFVKRNFSKDKYKREILNLKLLNYYLIIRRERNRKIRKQGYVLVKTAINDANNRNNWIKS